MFTTSCGPALPERAPVLPSPSRSAPRGPSPRTLARLRALLLTICGAIVAATVALPSLSSGGDRVRASGDLPVIDFRGDDDAAVQAVYGGIDRRGRPFSFNADKARNLSDPDVPMDLTAPKGRLTLKSGKAVELTAQTGEYDRRAERVDLSGDVRLQDPSGYDVRTTTATIDLPAGQASGDAPVVAEGPLGTIRSQGFRVTDSGTIVEFTGRAHMTVAPGAVANAP